MAEVEKTLERLKSLRAERDASEASYKADRAEWEAARLELEQARDSQTERAQSLADQVAAAGGRHVVEKVVDQLLHPMVQAADRLGGERPGQRGAQTSVFGGLVEQHPAVQQVDRLRQGLGARAALAAAAMVSTAVWPRTAASPRRRPAPT